MTGYLLLALLLSLNLYASRRVLRLPARGVLTAGWLLAIWTLPLLGAVLAWLQTLAAPAEWDDLPPPGEQPPAPGHWRSGGESLPWRELLFESQGMLMADLPRLRAAAARQDILARSAARLDAQRGWWLHLRDWLDAPFWLYEDEDTLVLSPLPQPALQATLRCIARARKGIRKLLPGLAHWPDGHKTLLLVLSDEELYYRYATLYYPEEGEFAASSGMFIDGFYPHFVVTAGDASQIEAVIAHELTHAALAHLKLPRWLDEGIAVNTEWQLIPPAGPAATDLPARHREFWDASRMQAFWRGELFMTPGEANALSYDLARVLVANLAREWPPFVSFVNKAAAKGCGRAAAEALNLDLGRFAAAVVGHDYDESWAP